jgi:ribonuclease E
MAITFEPREGLMAGTFEIERTQQKTAEEQERFASAVVQDVINVPEETTDETVEEEAEVVDEGLSPAPQIGAPQAPPSKRRRRRRGGRGRSSGDRPSSQDGLHQHHHGTQAAMPETTAEGTASAAETSVAPETAQQPGSNFSNPVPGQPAATRKRRRRRGRRGSGHGSAPQFGHHSQPSASRTDEVDRFGNPDEVDTTPRAESAHEARRTEPEHASPAMPNGASTPVWTLSSQNTEQQSGPTGASQPEPFGDAHRETQRSSHGDTVTGSEQVPKAAKKGWWQRTFRSES